MADPIAGGCVLLILWTLFAALVAAGIRRVMPREEKEGEREREA